MSSPAIGKRQTRRRLLPTVPIQPGFDPAVAFLGDRCGRSVLCNEAFLAYSFMLAR
jgi:hypothetical protein